MIDEDETPIDRADVLTEQNRASLREQLRAHLQETLSELARWGEWPRPYSAPLVLDEHRHQLPIGDKAQARRQLAIFLQESGIGKILRSTGHAWFWHHEVFEDLFVELYARRVKRTENDIDQAVFNELFNAAWAEINAESTKLRQVFAINFGIRLRQALDMGDGIMLTPYELNTSGSTLWELLQVEMQRDPLEVRPRHEGVFLSHEVSVPKSGEGREMIGAFDQLQTRGRDLVLAMRLAAPSRNVLEATYLAQISPFPIFPFMQEATPYSRISYGIGRDWAEETTSAFKEFVSGVGAAQFKRLRAMSERYQRSFRSADDPQNVIDLVVCLEGMVDVANNAEGLKNQCTMRTAALLGSTDEERLKIHSWVSAAYDIRSALVHGNADPSTEVRKALGRAGFMTRNDQETSEAILELVHGLREWVRCGLGARVLSKGPWPSNRWNEIVLNPSAASEARKSLGI